MKIDERNQRRYTPEVIKKRITLTSRSPTMIEEPMKDTGISQIFRTPPPLRIKVANSEFHIFVEAFFGKFEGEEKNFVNDDGLAISFIKKFSEKDDQEKVAQALINILLALEKEADFIKVLQAADRISNMKNGLPASLCFLKRIDFELNNIHDKDALATIGKVFTNSDILAALNVLSCIGEKTLRSATERFIELALVLKNASTIGCVGRTIVKLDQKFGKHVIYSYRTALSALISDTGIPFDKKVKLVELFSAKVLSQESDASVIECAELFERSLTGGADYVLRILENMK
ncbi:MAG: hypothetical protein QXT45_00405 [Candidatus Bilamarchaeaceae archaeon]